MCDFKSIEYIFVVDRNIDCVDFTFYYTDKIVLRPAIATNARVFQLVFLGSKVKENQIYAFETKSWTKVNLNIII